MSRRRKPYFTTWLETYEQQATMTLKDKVLNYFLDRHDGFRFLRRNHEQTELREEWIRQCIKFGGHLSLLAWCVDNGILDCSCQRDFFNISGYPFFEREYFTTWFVREDSTTFNPTTTKSASHFISKRYSIFDWMASKYCCMEHSCECNNNDNNLTAEAV